MIPNNRRINVKRLQKAIQEEDEDKAFGKKSSRDQLEKEIAVYQKL